MTLWANIEGGKVVIHGNINLHVDIEDSRVTEYAIAEHTSHLRSFWGQLGRTLDEAENQVSEAKSE